MMPVLVPYLIGVVTAPLVARVVTPVVRGTVKTTIELGLHARISQRRRAPKWLVPELGRGLAPKPGEERGREPRTVPAERKRR
jgi:hypothetical protein